MPNFLENMRLLSLATSEKEETVSLIELLLTDQAETYNKQTSIASNDGVSGNKVRTRKDRRRSGRSASTRQRTKAKQGGATQRLEQLRTAKKDQQKRKKELLAYQSQTNQKNQGPMMGVMSLKTQQSTADAAKQQREKSKSVEINPALRPVILAFVEFKPIFTPEGKFTDAGKLMKANRAIRALGIESTSAPSTAEEFISTLDYTDAYAQLIVGRDAFLDALDVSNIEMLDEALSAFCIDPDTIGETSNTEVLWTLVREYSRSLALCTPRLEEQSERDLVIGKNILAFSRSETASMRWALAPGNKTDFDKRSSNAESKHTEIFRTIIDGDEEVNLKLAINTIAKELLLSHNITINSFTESSEVNIKDMFQNRSTRRGTRTTIEPSTWSTSVNRPFGRKNLHGITYALPRPQSGHFYPFERSELLPDSKSQRQQNSAPDEIKKIFESSEPAEADGPYSAISTSYFTIQENIEKLFSSDVLEQTLADDEGEEVQKAYSLVVFERILDEIILQILTDNADTASSKSAKVFANWLYIASTNKTTFGWLLLYLAFLREKIAGDWASSKTTASDSTYGTSLTNYVMNSGGLTNLLGGSFSGLKKTRRFTVPTSKTTVDPGFESDDGSEFSTIKNSTERKVKTVTDAAEGEEIDENQELAAAYDISFEDMCKKCAYHLAGKINNASLGPRASTLSIPTTRGSKSNVTKDDIDNILQAIPTEETSIAHKLLFLIGDINDTLSEAGGSAFDDNFMSVYSAIPKANMSVGVIGASCVMASLLLGKSLRVIGDIPRGKTTTTIVGGRISDASLSLAGQPDTEPTGIWGGESGYSMSTGSPSISGGVASIGAVTDTFATLYLDTTGFLKSTIEEYLADGTTSAASVLTALSEPTARVVTALQEEGEFNTKFAESLATYFANVSSTYADIVSALNYDVDSTDVEEKLIERIRAGLPMSNDMMKMLMNFTRVYDSSGETYGESRTRDKALSSTNLSFLANTLQEPDFGIPDKLKYMVVGLPVGMLDSVKSQPVNLEDSTRSMLETSKTSFTLTLDKIDLTRPQQEFKSKEFSFSRDLFYSRTEEVSSEPNVYFDKFNSDFSISEEDETSISDDISEEQIYNLKVDAALKLYSDLLLDLDFYPDAYPKGKDQQTLVLTSSVSLPKLGGVDKTTEAFLSGSNVTFDVEQRELSGFLFFKDGSNSLDMNMFQGLDPTAYSIYTYLNRYGGFADAASKKNMLKYGTTFERIICIPFDPTDFDSKPSSIGDDVAAQKAAMTKLAEAEKEVGIGLESSQGVELSTFRVAVHILESGTEETS